MEGLAVRALLDPRQSAPPQAIAGLQTSRQLLEPLRLDLEAREALLGCNYRHLGLAEVGGSGAVARMRSRSFQEFAQRSDAGFTVVGEPRLEPGERLAHHINVAG